LGIVNKRKKNEQKRQYNFEKIIIADV